MIKLLNCRRKISHFGVGCDSMAFGPLASKRLAASVLERPWSRDGTCNICCRSLILCAVAGGCESGTSYISDYSFRDINFLVLCLSYGMPKPVAINLRFQFNAS